MLVFSRTGSNNIAWVSFLNVSFFVFQDDLVGKSVYNIIHVGDHAQFSNSLLPMSVSKYTFHTEYPETTNTTEYNQRG